MSSWTEERILALKQLWSDGLSCSEIGRRLDVSKNAIIGKAHRLGLPGRPSPIKRGGATTRKLVKTDSAVVRLPNKKAPRCCWIEGDPQDAGSYRCCKESLKGKPYCSEHYAMAYITVRSRAAA